MAKKVPVVDLTKPEKSTLVLPQPPILSSQQAWENIFLAHYRHSAYESPEHYLMQHTLLITDTNVQFRVEQRLDGKFKQYHHGLGRLDLFPANLSHWATWDRETEFSIVAICPKFFEKIAQEHIKGNSLELIPQFSIVDPTIGHIALALKAEVEAGCTTGSLYGESLATALVMRLIQNYSACKPQIFTNSNGLTKYQLQQVIDYINTHLDQNISLTDIAKVATISQSHFARLFKQSMGITPHQYLTQQRVERAKNLLHKRQIPIADIAFQCGFANQTHLTKRFRQLIGITPKAYQKKC
ncbi:transcriptional regulator [Calothrix parasitica NIES-267]|uniref:Transcriptional regulator n=1 Tax=Calothrix parasitica NIES-267 TaxID=1973488 RepID=A0A1Z4LVQ3_9CYAN|nr:transcriptional regulator [Calothrix parasitica NIES-267]